MYKTYTDLRAELTRNCYNQADLIEIMGKSKTYLTERFTGVRGWNQEDMYFLLDLIKVPYEKMHVYFPPKGRRLSNG